MSITFKLINSVTNGSTIYVGVPDNSLVFTLTNTTDGAITYTNASKIQINMPEFFTADDVKTMTLSDDSSSDWSLDKTDADWNILYLTYKDVSNMWNVNKDITFTITNVAVTSATSSISQPTTVSFRNFTENPSSVSTNLTVMQASTTSNDSPSLKEVLQVFLEDQGKIYVSDPGDALENTLYLNFKNIGIHSLYDDTYGSPPASYDPTVQVSFVYGSDDSSGVLAPDNDKSADAQGSAWNIDCSIDSSQGNDWTVEAPDKQKNQPIWELKPASTNTDVIKTGEDANISFSFSNIISFTPPGSTQMTVLFTGFMKDANTVYEETVFTLNIVKLDVPPLRGILDFYSEDLRFSTKSIEMNIDLKWTMAYVDKVIISTNLSMHPSVEIPYPDPEPIAKGKHTLTFSGIAINTLVNITLQAFDANGNYLNAMQSMVFLQDNLFTDVAGFTDAAGKNYPTVEVNSLLWMAANLDYETPGGGSHYYNDDPDNQVPYGRLYNKEDASKDIPDGWRLPTLDDWKDLINTFGGLSNKQAYFLLGTGGMSMFNAVLGGYADQQGLTYKNITYQYYNINSIGFYLTSTEADSSCFYIVYFNWVKDEITTGNGYSQNKFSVRYVKDIEVV